MKKDLLVENIIKEFIQANPKTFDLSYMTEEVLSEGLYDQSKLKVIFMGGGPGSGKDYVMKKTMGGMGFTEINSDNALEFLMKRNGLNMKMPENEKRERDILRGRAKNTTKEKQRLAVAGRNGLIVNGTADDAEKIYLIKKELDALGYDSMFLFVNTSNEVSKERNFMRGVNGGRKVPDGTDDLGNPNGTEDIRALKWKAAQDSRPFMKKLFGPENYIEFDNSADANKIDPIQKQQIEDTLGNIWKTFRSFSVAPNRNEIGNQWVQSEIEKRQIKKYEKARAQAYGDPNNPQAGVQQTAPPAHLTPTQGDMPDQNQLSQAQLMGLTYYGFGRYGKEINGRHTVTHISRNGQLVQKPVNRTTPITQTTRVQQMAEERKIPGYLKPRPALDAALKAIETEFSPEKMKEMKRKSDERRANDPGFNKWLSDRGRKNPYVKEENTKMKGPDPCWKGYEMIGKKKKNGREVPNCVPVKENNIDKDFAKFMHEIDITKPENREFGTTSLTKIYKKMTPGQCVNENKNPVEELEKSLEKPESYNAIDNVMQGIAKKCGVTPAELHKSFVDKHNKTPDDWIKSKDIKKEDNNTSNLPVSDGIGPETTSRRPMIVYGFAGADNVSESIQRWMNNPNTQKRFAEKYGDLAEQKIIETAQKLNVIKTNDTGLKSISAIREAYEAAPYGKDPADTLGFYSGRRSEVDEESTPAWQRKEGKDPEGGLNRKGIASYRRENPGSKLSMAVTTKPSKLKPGSKKAKRRLSFCRRMTGMKKKLTSAKTARDPDSRINKSLRKWNCEE